MDVLDTITKEDLKRLLVKCWMTHDAMWFANTLQRDGVDAANALNLAAIHSLAPIEVKRLAKLLGMPAVRDTATLRRFLEGALALMADDTIEFAWTWRDDGTLRVDTNRCFAFEGISRLGVIADYQCGIFERIYAWLEALDVDYEVSPGGKACMMHHEGACYREFRFRFVGESPPSSSIPG